MPDFSFLGMFSGIRCPFWAFALLFRQKEMFLGKRSRFSGISNAVFGQTGIVFGHFRCRFWANRMVFGHLLTRYHKKGGEHEKEKKQGTGR